MNEAIYFLRLDNQQAGPFTLTELEAMWKTGKANATTLYWRDGQAEWEPLANLAHLLPPVAAAPPPPPLPQLAPRPSFTPVGGPSSMPTSWANPTPQTSGLAITSLILGILGIFTLITSLPAIICGHMALGRIGRSGGDFSGRGMAITGLVLGYLMLFSLVAIAGIAILAGIAVPVFSEVQERGKSTKDLLHVRQISMAIQAYAVDFDDRTPPNLEALIPNYLADQATLISPFAPNAGPEGYKLLLPNTKLSAIEEPHTTPLLRGNYATRKKRRSYGYADGACEVKTDDALDELTSPLRR